ncbi:MAG: quinolinate synthase NadA [Desulfovibrionaceae bacterium]|nr:quinolinate synthase NadA [Desulfovibrionaceae bacterium]
MTTLSETAAQIEQLRRDLGSTLTILGHHYQNDNIVGHCDFLGDSLELARRIEHIQSKHIVFCGVHFMAESAALLAGSGQRVYIPDPEADCLMARMSPAGALDRTLAFLTAGGQRLMPLAYVNTTLAVKAVVGRYGGTVCTSANAKKMLAWALEQSGRVLFLPDKNLGRNTAHDLGIDDSEIFQLTLRNGEIVNADQAGSARILLWPGFCPIHDIFMEKDLQSARAKDPACRIIVHPESSPEVTAMADAAGSTSFLIRCAAEAKAGDHLVIGTESNLVCRLRDLHASRGVIIDELDASYCKNMAKITPEKLLQTLQDIANGSAEAVVLRGEEIEPAKAALERMLQVCA